jgi:hypothetical protein
MPALLLCANTGRLPRFTREGESGEVRYGLLLVVPSPSFARLR